MRPGELQAGCPGACTTQREGSLRTRCAPWAGCGGGRQKVVGIMAMLMVRVRPGLIALSDHVLPPSLPCMHLKRGAQKCVFLGDDDRLQVELGLWMVGSCLFVPLGLSREPRKKGPWQVAQEELWTQQAETGPSAEPGQSAPGLLGTQVSPLLGSTQWGSPNTSATAEEGPGDCLKVRSKGQPEWPGIQRPWPLIPPSIGPPVTSGAVLGTAQ